MLELFEVVFPVPTFDHSLDLSNIKSRRLRVISWVKISTLTHLRQNMLLYVLSFLALIVFYSSCWICNSKRSRHSLLGWRLHPLSFGLKTIHQNKWLWIQHRLVKLEPHYFFATSFRFLWFLCHANKRLNFLDWLVTPIMNQEPWINHTEPKRINRSWWLASKLEILAFMARRLLRTLQIFSVRVFMAWLNLDKFSKDFLLFLKVTPNNFSCFQRGILTLWLSLSHALCLFAFDDFRIFFLLSLPSFNKH